MSSSGNGLSFNTNADVGSGDGGSGYLGLDATADGSAAPFAGHPVLPPVTLATTDLRITRLNLAGVSAGTSAIAVDALNSSFFTAQQNLVNTLVSFTSSAGSITFANAAAVPEPTTFLALLWGAFGVAEETSSKFRRDDWKTSRRLLNFVSTAGTNASIVMVDFTWLREKEC